MVATVDFWAVWVTFWALVALIVLVGVVIYSSRGGG